MVWFMQFNISIDEQFKGNTGMDTGEVNLSQHLTIWIFIKWFTIYIWPHRMISNNQWWYDLKTHILITENDMDDVVCAVATIWSRWKWVNDYPSVLHATLIEQKNPSWKPVIFRHSVKRIPSALWGVRYNYLLIGSVTIVSLFSIT